MRTKLMLLASMALCLFCATLVSSCSQSSATATDPLDGARRQLELLLADAQAADANPRTVETNGQTHWIKTDGFDWTEGFFPGSLWYMYEVTGEERWREAAQKFQSKYENHKLLSYHDLGFVFNCSFGNGYRLTGDTTMRRVLIEAGNTLVGRFNPVVGSIKSWNEDRGWQSKRGWQFPVIIDNMMNLEMLFELTKMTGDSTYAKVAIAHANTTMKNHFRPDNSSYHVVDYDPHTGAVRSCQTAQGYAHESVWARGQAWGIYGYTLCYRYTRDTAYLDMACKIGDFIVSNPAIVQDGIPYWDYNDPKIPDSPRDVSAAAITLSAMVELEQYVPGKYTAYADKLFASLASSQYTAQIGENNNFILKHSVGSIPHNNEIDVPLNYADYYYIEALIKDKRVSDKRQ